MAAVSPLKIRGRQTFEMRLTCAHCFCTQIQAVRRTSCEQAHCTVKAVRELDRRELAASAMKTAFHDLVSQQHAKYSFEFGPSESTGSPSVGLRGAAPMSHGQAVSAPENEGHV